MKKSILFSLNLSKQKQTQKLHKICSFFIIWGILLSSITFMSIPKAVAASDPSPSVTVNVG